FCKPRSRSDKKSLESRAHTRRLEQRIGGRCRGADVRGGDRIANGRLGRKARGILWNCVSGSAAAKDQPEERVSFGVVIGSRGYLRAGGCGYRIDAQYHGGVACR